MADLDLLPTKLLALLVRPDFWLWLGLVTAMGALLAGWRRLAGWVLASIVAAVTLVGFVPVGDVWLAPLERRIPPLAAPPSTASAIIILGGGEDAVPAAAWGTTALNEAGDRFVHALRRAHALPGVPVLFTGGAFDPTGDPLRRDSAARVRAMLEQAGLDPARLQVADGARTTAEHPADVTALLARTGITPSPEAPLLLVTSAFHMPRALGVFCAAGIGPVVADPADHRTAPGQGWRHALRWDYAAHLAQLQLAIREWVALIAYRAAGHTPAVLPGPCADPAPSRS